VLDVAAGAGRHTLWLASRGHRLTAVDRDAASIAALAPHAERSRRTSKAVRGRSRAAASTRSSSPTISGARWPTLKAALAPGGVLLYETFASGNETVGRPKRSDFLLAHGELLAVAAGLRIVAYEDGFLADPDRFVQRLAAVREAGGDEARRYPLRASRADGDR
jgi:2-polyprenyl-3-methyl-5-hydroxy-6-metoxy-1,4-benzoquinol methylase